MKAQAVKVGLIILALTAIFTNGATATDDNPSWINKEEVVVKKTDVATFVYAVGKSPYTLANNEEEFDEAFIQASQVSQKKLRKFLQISDDRPLKGFQVINLWFTDQNLYVLGVVRKELNETPTENPTEEACSPCQFKKVSADYIKAYDTIPKNWWTLYSDDPQATNVFRVGDYLIGIGKGIKNPKQLAAQQRAGAITSATSMARRNLLKVCVTVITEILGDGDWKETLQGVIQGSAMVPNFLAENTHFDGDNVYVIFYLKVDTIVEASQKQ